MDGHFFLWLLGIVAIGGIAAFLLFLIMDLAFVVAGPIMALVILFGLVIGGFAILERRNRRTL